MAAHDAVINQDQALANHIFLDDIELQGDTLLAQRIRGLDKGPSDVAVFDEPVGIGNSRGVGIADGCRNGRIRHGYDQVCLCGTFQGKAGTQLLADQVGGQTIEIGIRT